jgi:internalin A
LKDLNSLKKLSFDSCPRVTDAGLKELAGLSNLQSLTLGGTQVKGPGLRELKGLKQLRTVTFGDALVTDEILRNLRQAGLLHALSSASGKTGVRPANPAEVEALGLNSDTGVTDAGLKELKEFTNLQYLFLSGAGVTDAGLKELRDFKSLHTLDLSSTAVTDVGLRELKDCKGLETLYLRQTRVTDAGVKELKAALPRCEIAR